MRIRLTTGPQLDQFIILYIYARVPDKVSPKVKGQSIAGT
jgi:hypothetical protein